MSLHSSYNTLRFILGDQLNRDHSWFDHTDDSFLYVIMEMKQETNYTKHHIQKVVAFFSAMEKMAKDLEKKGHHVLYIQLDNPYYSGSLEEDLSKIISNYSIQKFEYQLPDEYRLDEQLKQFCCNLKIESEAFDTEHFLTERYYLKSFFEGKKSLLMESFYRDMRKKYNILMESNDSESPLTGKWNYDHDNRGSLKKDHEVIEPKLFSNDVSTILSRIESCNVKTIGHMEGNECIWPVTLDQANEMLDFFLEECLCNFGKYQDAMVERAWSVYHSRLSFCLNSKIIKPLYLVRKAIQYWGEHQDKISIAQIEGFVRQIIGWREYMRGIYWSYMPEFKEMNYFDHSKDLPSFYWNGKTKMNCMKQAIHQSLDYAYAHHIQRLMITGNFALLAGIDPAQVDEWYLGIYIDAIEWVEITNTRGMSQFADGGIVGTKPYVSSANYINKMSDYCKNCQYNYKLKTGENACPFNSLYWRFYEVNRPLLSNNPRIGMMYNVWDKNSDSEKREILDHAEEYLINIDEL